MLSKTLAVLALMLGCGVGSAMSILTNFNIEVPNPTQQRPVTAAIKVLSDRKTNVVTRGEHLVVFVRARIWPSFHIYGLNKSGTENTPTSLKLTLPKDVKIKFNWNAPEPIKKGKARTYEQEVTFISTLVIGKKAPPGKHTIKCEMEYQVCDEELCWPPAKLDLATEIEVIASK